MRAPVSHVQFSMNINPMGRQNFIAHWKLHRLHLYKAVIKQDHARVINMDCSLYHTRFSESDVVFLMLACEVFSQPDDTYLLCSVAQEVSEMWAVTGGCWQGTASSWSIVLPGLSAELRKVSELRVFHTPLTPRMCVMVGGPRYKGHRDSWA